MYHMLSRDYGFVDKHNVTQQASVSIYGDRCLLHLVQSVMCILLLTLWQEGCFWFYFFAKCNCYCIVRVSLHIKQ